MRYFIYMCLLVIVFFGGIFANKGYELWTQRGSEPSKNPLENAQPNSKMPEELPIPPHEFDGKLLLPGISHDDIAFEQSICEEDQPLTSAWHERSPKQLKEDLTISLTEAGASPEDIDIMVEEMTRMISSQRENNAFQAKAMDRMKNLHSLTKCAIVVSHSPAQLKQLCNKVIWLEKGRVVMQGEPTPVLDAYQAFCKNPKEWMAKNSEYFYN